MKKNKKSIMYFLTLNIIASSYIDAASKIPLNSDKMYNNFIKNIERGKSNETNYKVLEKILNQKNKELKDLYLQNDYIVKPEYLEWQIFFTGFYEEYNKGTDNTKENAKYHSKVTGYYNTDGEYISTGKSKNGLIGKPYQPLQKPKDVNLGVNVPMKGIIKDPLNLSLTPAEEININPNTVLPAIPNAVVTPEIETFQFAINLPDVIPPSVTIPASFVVRVPDTANNDDTGSFLGISSSRTAKIAQYNLTSGLLEGTWNSANLSSYTADQLNGTRDSGGIVMAGSSTDPLNNYSFTSTTGDGATALYKLGGSESITLGTPGVKDALIMKITSNVGSNYSGTLPHLIQYDPHGGRNTYVPYTKDYFGDPITTPTTIFDSYGELNNYARLEGKGDSFLIIGLQTHTGNFSPTVKNYGTIIGLADSNYDDGGRRHVAFSFMAPQNHRTPGRRFEFYNMAGSSIEMQVKESIAFNFGASPALSTKPYFTIYNYGDVVLYGNNSVGVKTENNLLDLIYSKLVLDKAIRINGDQSVGVELAKLMDDGYGNTTPGQYDTQRAVIKVTIGDEPKTKEGNSTGTPTTVQQSIGLYVNNSSLDYRLGEYEFKFGDHAEKSTLININRGQLYLDNDRVSEIFIDKGQNNFGIIVNSGSAELTLAPNIKIGTVAAPVNGTIALYGDNGGQIHLAAANNIEVNGENSHAVILKGGAVLNNVTSGSNHSFTSTGKNSSLLYATDNALIDLSNSPEINVKATGDKSVGVYNKDGVIKLGVANTGTGTYEIGTNGVLFYNHGTGLGSIETSGTNFIVGNGSLFTKIETPSTTSGNEQIKFTHTAGKINLNLLSGGIGFVYTGDGVTPVTPSSMESYLKNNYFGLNNMNVTVNSGARLYLIEKYASINLSSIGAITAPASIFNNIDNLGGSKAFLLRGTLVLDSASGIIDLDSSTEDYNQIERALTGINVNSGVTVKGTQDNQIALFDDNSYESTKYVKMSNSGTIDLSGKNSVGIYTNRGEIKNSGTINVSGENSIAILSENATDTENSSNINIGNSGVGIYAMSHQNPTSLPNGTIIDSLTGTIKVKNSGIITATTGVNSTGIYAVNNKLGSTTADAQIDLSNGTINLGASENAVGVYVNKGTVSDSGSTITVGKNGIGIYAKDSILNLTNLTLNLFGDNSLGLYLDGNTDLITGNGTINIRGQNVVLFNINSTGTTMNNNFTIGTVGSGSSYILGNVIGGTFIYTGNSILTSNGTLAAGKNSAIYLNGSTVTANPGAVNTAAIVLDSAYSGTSPFGMTSNTDGENNGIIILGNDSSGIYGKNGSRISNKGTITVGNSSAGLMTSGTGSFILNGGTITSGVGSQGLYLKGGSTIDNLSSGNILSSGMGTVGIYSNSNSGNITNAGNIDLSGDRSIGMYSTGASNSIINTGTGVVKVGDSANTTDPSIGIYSSVAGTTVTNNGTVTSGKNSIGIYTNGGYVTTTGISNIGDSGVGIYASNGAVDLNAGSTLNLGTDKAVGVYGVYSNITSSNNFNIGNGNYGFILKGGSFASSLGANILGTNSVYLYSTEASTIANGADIIMTGMDNVGFYLAKDPTSGLGGGSITNTGNIDGTAGLNNIGIYNYGGNVNNLGTINIGNSDIKFLENNQANGLDVDNSRYAVGIYGENAAIINQASASIRAGYGSYGIVAKGGTAVNFGNIITTGDYSTGMYTEGGIITNNSTIDVSGNNSIGMAGKGRGSQIINNGIINIFGDNSIGMYGGLGTIITNTGIINITGNSQALVSTDIDMIHDTESNSALATINGDVNNKVQFIGSAHKLPVLINAGIIKTNGILALNGTQVMIKPDPATKVPSSNPDYEFILSGTSIIADEILTSKPIVILPGFSDGTVANVYKLEGLIKANSGQYDFISGSLLWQATPRATEDGVDVYMERKTFTEFTDGLWFEDFGSALENNYLKATGNGVEIYNKTAYIQTEEDFRHIVASLAGNVYANINQRENDISRAFENSLDFIESSENNTKENVKINIIAGKGKNKEETDGVVGYDYTTTGILALREVERTYKHKFGYSLGYLRTGFEFKDGNESEEWVDTIQLGIHNKYTSNDWILKNDLMGRVSFHNIDRNVDWSSPLKRSEMNGSYETYSITSDNKLGREFELGKNSSIMPYAGLRAMYVTRPTFKESGLEALEVEGNDAWSVKPRVGVEVQTALPIGNTAWQLKGSLDFSYEYELVDLNERERAKLVSIEDGYHKLSKPKEEKGIFRTKASIGVEVKEKYGVFLTGEYKLDDEGNNKDDYRVGVTLKAVF